MRERRAVAMVTAVPFTQTKRRTNTIEVSAAVPRENGIIEKTQTQAGGLFYLEHITFLIIFLPPTRFPRLTVESHKILDKGNCFLLVRRIDK